MSEIQLEVGTSVIEVLVGQQAGVQIETGQYMPVRPKGIDYEGSYEVTPSGSVQVLPTRGRLMTQNLTVAPIPSNYGLITYSGGILTVS